jgi:hypothetical protein
VRCTQDELWARGELRVGEDVVFDREWSYPLERESGWTTEIGGRS